MSDDLGQPRPGTREITRRELLRVLGAAAAASVTGARDAAAMGAVGATESMPSEVASQAVFRVVALGDSVMWGQGLASAQKFDLLVAERLAAAVGRRPAVTNRARSGAPITAEEDLVAFAKRYPSLFRDASARAEFLRGRVGAALSLYRELPASFPTVRQQLALVDAAEAQRTDLLLLNGGINDLDKSKVLQPDGYDLADLEGRLEAAMYRGVRELLRDARASFPGAVIIVPGYFPLLSNASSLAALTSLLNFLGVHVLFEESRDNVEINNALGVWTGWHASIKDVEQMARRMRSRAQFAYRRALEHQRRAVAEAHAAERGAPGIFFAHPRFQPGHALYADGTPMFWEGYNPPTDPVRQARVDRCPRAQHAALLETTARRMAEAQMNPGNVVIFRAAQEAARRALAVLDGPEALRGRFQEILDARPIMTGAEMGQRREHFRTTGNALRREMRRIATARIASLFHPNVAGAARYADAITRTYRDSRAPRLEPHLRRLEPGAGPTTNVSALLERWGLDPNAPPAVTCQYMSVDAVALRIETVSHSGVGDAAWHADAWLRTARGRWHLRSSYMDNRFEPLPGSPAFVRYDELRTGHTARFTFDPAGEMHLAELGGARLEYKGNGNSAWKVGDVELSVNGRVVFRDRVGRTLRGEASTPIGYPKPA